MGYSLLTGAPLRFRFYTSWGMSALAVSKLVGFGVITYWAGLFAIIRRHFRGEIVPYPGLPGDIAGEHLVLGFGLLLVVGAYLTLARSARQAAENSRREDCDAAVPAGHFAGSGGLL